MSKPYRQNPRIHSIRGAWMLWLSLLSVAGCTRGCGETAPAPKTSESGKPGLVGELVRLSGVVLDAAGKPVPSAEIFVWPSGREHSNPSEALTDAQGRFEVGGLVAGPHELMVQTTGLGVAHLDRVMVPASAVSIAVEGTGMAIGGIVRSPPRGGSLDRVAVLLGSPTLRHPRAVSVDAQGRFVISGMGPGEYTIRAADDDSASTTARIMIEEGQPVPTDSVLQLVPAGSITGRVIDLKRNALSAAEVEIRSTPDDDCGEVARADVVGYFATRALPPGTYQVAVKFPGHVIQQEETVHLTDRSTTLEIAMARASSISGRVVDVHGTPVTGARILLAWVQKGSAVPSSPALHLGSLDLPVDRLSVLSGPLPLVGEVGHSETVVALSDVTGRLMEAIGRSGEDGLFRVAPLYPGRFSIRIEHSDFVPTTLPARAVGEASDVDLGSLHLDPGVVVRGTVMGPEGARGSVRVEALAIRGTNRFSAHADLEGRFELRVPPGAYRVRAAAMATEDDGAGVVVEAVRGAELPAVTVIVPG
jgi:Carboxypeptidase regulatory-like domain